MKIARSVLLYAAAAISFFIGTTLTLGISFFMTERNRARAFQRAAHIWARFLIILSGIPVEVRRPGKLPEGEGLVIVSNHQGAIDILLVLAFIDAPFSFIIKKELFSAPLFGWYLRKAGYIEVDRGTTRGAVQMFMEAKKVLSAKGSILVFPEGTRSPDGRLQEFKKGSMLLALKSGARVLPVAVSGSYDIMPKKSYVINPVRVRMAIGEPISLINYASDPDGANLFVRGVIQGMLSELQR